LPVYVAFLNSIRIYNGHPAYSGTADLLGRVSSYAPQPDHQYMAMRQMLHPFDAKQ
jgi:hypothetical protein